MLIHLLLVNLLCWPIAIGQTSETCANLERAFLNALNKDSAVSETEPACRCMPKNFGQSEEDEEFIFVGCTRQDMPSVYRALHAVNETNVTQLTIWDAVTNMLPSDMFAKIRPKILSIEGSGLSFFRKEPFADLSDRLKSLFLRNNILQKIDKQTFASLHHLQLLDLSSNKLKSIQKEAFSQLTNLEVLMFSNNKIATIEDGAFENLVNLRTLNLADNKLQKITKNTFRGLKNLEVLELESNQIEQIDWHAFQNMPKLRVFNLGHNKLTRVDLRNLINLENLLLNGNEIPSMRQISLHNLPKLMNLRLDRNNINEIRDDDMNGIRGSLRIRSLSLVANNLSRIDSNAFGNLPQLTTLSLQNNAITSLQSPSKIGAQRVSWLAPLQKLKRIFLSQNNITTLENGDLNVIPTLEEVSMDNNQLNSIDKNALKGLQLKKLFLNNNSFHYLPEGIFEGWDTEEIFSVDLAENPWECICGHEWIGEWLSKLGDRSTPSGNIGCVVYQQQRCEHVDEGPKHSAWITVFAGVLTFIALLFLTAIAYLYLQEACARSPLPLRRIPSDMVRLIPSVESLTYPNPVAAETTKSGWSKGMKKSTSLNGKPAKLANNVHRSSSSDESSKAEKKRVRFDGI